MISFFVCVVNVVLSVFVVMVDLRGLMLLLFLSLVSLLVAGILVKVIDHRLSVSDKVHHLT
jgi:H+/Cl- antiporter ClcA